jgi:transcriptional regulator with GAF, ATPase, and Fis domain
MDDVHPEGPGSHHGALMRVTDDENLTASLRRIADAGCAVLDDCAAASITLILDGRAVTMAATDEVATSLDRAQYEVDDGPCLTAARQREVVRIHDAGAEGRWPHFCDAARAHHIASSLSVPLVMAEAGTLGGLNVYGRTSGAFDDDDERLASTFAAQASIAVSNVVAYWSSFELTRNLHAAMEHRGVIEQAKGILMAVNRCSPDDAFAMLRRRSQAENRKLRDIAVDVVTETQRGPR